MKVNSFIFNITGEHPEALENYGQLMEFHPEGELEAPK